MLIVFILKGIKLLTKKFFESGALMLDRCLSYDIRLEGNLDSLKTSVLHHIITCT